VRRRELVFADAMVGLGLAPVLEPALGGNKPDLSVRLSDETIFAEVVTPDRSDAISEAYEQISGLAGLLMNACPSLSVELLLSPTASLGSLSDIAARVAAAPIADLVQELPGLGLLLKNPAPPTPIVEPSIRHAKPGPVIGTAKGGVTGGIVTLAAVRLPIDDKRAQRVLAAELHHFQRDQVNLLVMDVTLVIDGSVGWTDLIRRCFQPTRNLRIGAVILFEGSTVGSKAANWERWTVLRNPHAYRTPPNSLLDQIASLDSGPYDPSVRTK
jgi:hypothetical protein